MTSCLPDSSAIADRYEVSGIDVSHYQGAIEWEELAADGHDFAFIKAPPVIDVEERGKLSAKQLVKRVTRLAEMMEIRYGVKPIIYTGQNFYNRFLAGQFDDYPLWLARYDVDEPVTVCGRAYAFWQYTDRGQLSGIDGNVDRNVFLGSHLDLAMLCVPPSPSAGPADLAGKEVPATKPEVRTDDLASFGR